VQKVYTVSKAGSSNQRCFLRINPPATQIISNSLFLVAWLIRNILAFVVLFIGAWLTNGFPKFFRDDEPN
jgi:hypothetical protein